MSLIFVAVVVDVDAAESWRRGGEDVKQVSTSSVVLLNTNEYSDSAGCFPALLWSVATTAARVGHVQRALPNQRMWLCALFQVICSSLFFPLSSLDAAKRILSWHGDVAALVARYIMCVRAKPFTRGRSKARRAHEAPRL
jgi:hypothetical protein